MLRSAARRRWRRRNPLRHWGVSEVDVDEDLAEDDGDDDGRPVGASGQQHGGDGDPGGRVEEGGSDRRAEGLPRQPGAEQIGDEDHTEQADRVAQFRPPLLPRGGLRLSASIPRPVTAEAYRSAQSVAQCGLVLRFSRTRTLTCVESEGLTQFAFQETPVAGLQESGGEQHECRWPRGGLEWRRRIREVCRPAPAVALPRPPPSASCSAGRWRCGSPRMPTRSPSPERASAPRPPGHRRDVHPRRPLNLTQLQVDLSVEQKPAILVDQIPLVEREYQSASSP